jgi:hypothetical protein
MSMARSSSRARRSRLSTNSNRSSGENFNICPACFAARFAAFISDAHLFFQTSNDRSFSDRITAYPASQAR